MSAMDAVSVFSTKFQQVISKPITNILWQSNQTNTKDVDEIPERIIKSDNSLSCSYCKVAFSDGKQQRDHYKLDWHRYNLKQSLILKPPISEEGFLERTNRDDLSSISGSDSEKDEDVLENYALAQGKIFLKSDVEGKIFSVYRCILFDKKEEVTDSSVLHTRLNQISSENTKWTILMLGGGHFAGAVFQKDETILHKTFHCYTVRAGQGGSQSSRDNKSGGSHPKSAGASLRRYNEQALVQHVRSIVEAWRSEIDKSSLIIFRASGPYNRSVLFGGGDPLLNRSDLRLRTIPFSTRRATFAEVKRVHSVLSQSHIFNSLEAAHIIPIQEKNAENETKRSKSKTSPINRAKSREFIERPLPGQEKIKLKFNTSSESEDEECQEHLLEINDSILSFNELKEFDDSFSKDDKARSTKKKKTKKSKAKKIKEQEESRKNLILDTLIRGNVLNLKDLLDNHIKNVCGDESIVGEDDIKTQFVNEVLDVNGNSMLHIAAMNEHVELLNFLLENNGDLCYKNKKHQTPYTCTHSKDVREMFKLYARENPTKFNYNKANIPLITLTDEEITEKKKNQRKVKREKEKEKKKENIIKQKEQEEMGRFLKLSDREKRALAAERRILSNAGTISNTRCFLCAADITGKVPFEYLSNKFCSIDCLKAHRLQNPTNLT